MEKQINLREGGDFCVSIASPEREARGTASWAVRDGNGVGGGDGEVRGDGALAISMYWHEIDAST